jgi:hypothetical protein
MPHAHCLFILKDKILSARHIDSVVCAEVPDPTSDPELSDLVAKHMLHPICDVDTSHGCRRDNNNQLCDCRRHFPKPMSPSTIVVVDSYPTYMRRGRHTITMRDGRIITDNWVVPFNRQAAHVVSHCTFDNWHNRYLLKRYQCHLNVEVRIPIVAIRTCINLHFSGMRAFQVFQVRLQVHVQNAGSNCSCY